MFTRSPVRLRAVAAGAIFGLAVLAPPPGRAADAPPAAQPDYHPSLADIMTMSVQPRHIKLGLGGRARNWDYAAYEASELRNAFNRIARTVPTYRQTDLAGMFAANVKDPLDQIDAAIKARSGAGFDAGYVKLTHACNVCHQGLGHGYVVITAPAAGVFPDQSFTPLLRRKPG